MMSWSRHPRQPVCASQPRETWSREEGNPWDGVKQVGFDGRAGNCSWQETLFGNSSSGRDAGGGWREVWVGVSDRRPSRVLRAKDVETRLT